MSKTKSLIICAFFAAVISFTAPFSIVIGVVPITFVLFSLALTAFVLGSKKAIVATGIYILIGLVGLPVFSNFKGGLSAVMSPTGGFVFSYIFIVWILGFSVKTKKKSAVILLSVLALFVCYICGTAWYMLITKADLITALSLCILPFIPFDTVKIIMAYIVARKVRRSLLKSRVI